MDWTGFNPASLNGSYLNDETNVQLDIRHTEGNSYLIKIATREPVKGVLISKTKLLVNNYKLDIAIEPGSGPVLMLHSDRLRQVKFARARRTP